MLHTASFPWVSLTLSSAIGVLCAVGYSMLFKRFTVKALKSSDSSSIAWTVSGLFCRIILIGLTLFFLLRIPAINVLVVLMNFVTLVLVLFLWTVRGFSRQLIHHQ